MAPFGDVALGLYADSTWMTARTRSGRRPRAVAWRSIRPSTFAGVSESSGRVVRTAFDRAPRKL